MHWRTKQPALKITQGQNGFLRISLKFCENGKKIWKFLEIFQAVTTYFLFIEIECKVCSSTSVGIETINIAGIY